MAQRFMACALLLGAALAATAATTAEAGYPEACCAYHNATLWYPWHGNYYDPAWGGSPVALVVPPTATLQTKYSWGVTNTDVVRIYHQFGRRYPGYYNGGPGFVPTPPQPGSTDQFGVYYVRGPW
jgi:hypothetical protein